jgi:pimeloyl-ACP methyl ester carboxylesterase
MDIPEFTARRRTLRAAAGDIAYTESGAGPAAVFVHGLATSGALWRHVIEQVDGTTRCIAVDLPLHGGTAPRQDLSVTAMAQLIADLCQGLGLDRIDLVGNDTGGVVAQILAARHPELLRSLVLTNCDTEGNFPPPAFLPVIQAAARGQIAPLLTVAAADPAAARMSPLATGYELPDQVPDEVWREYLTPIGATIEQARLFERMLTALDPAELEAVTPRLRHLDVPVLLVWGTAEEALGLEWAYRLRDLIPGAREVVEIDGAKLFFPEERPEKLAFQLRRHWRR